MTGKTPTPRTVSAALDVAGFRKCSGDTEGYWVRRDASCVCVDVMPPAKDADTGQRQSEVLALMAGTLRGEGWAVRERDRIPHLSVVAAAIETPEEG